MALAPQGKSHAAETLRLNEKPHSFAPVRRRCGFAQARLSRDRRTLGRALRGVRADGTTRSGYPGWFIETVLRALGSRDKARGDDGPTPRGFEVIDRGENR